MNKKSYSQYRREEMEFEIERLEREDRALFWSDLAWIFSVFIIAFLGIGYLLTK